MVTIDKKKDGILKATKDAVKVVEKLTEESSIDFIYETSIAIAKAFKNGNKILIAGNGGSLCDAMHFAEEFTGFFRDKRRALPAIAISDPGHMSCTSNDLGYEFVFERAVEAFGKIGDIFISLTTSGNSPNLIFAANKAKGMGLKTVAFLGKTGGKMKGVCDLEWTVDGFSTSDRIQEAHMAAIHIIIEHVEKELFVYEPYECDPCDETEIRESGEACEACIEDGELQNCHKIDVEYAKE